MIKSLHDGLSVLNKIHFMISYDGFMIVTSRTPAGLDANANWVEFFLFFYNNSICNTSAVCRERGRLQP